MRIEPALQVHQALIGGRGQQREVVQAGEFSVGAHAQHGAQRQARAHGVAATDELFGAVGAGQARVLAAAEVFILERAASQLGKAQCVQPGRAQQLVADADLPGLQAAVDEHGRFHRATGVVDGEGLVGLDRGAAPAAHLLGLAHRHLVGRHGFQGQRRGQQLIDHGALMAQQLRGDYRSEIGRRLDLCRDLLEQRLRIAGRHQEADQLAIEPLGYIDASHRAGHRHAGAAAHAGVDRTGEQQLVVEAARDHAVVGAFGNREAQVQRIAQRVQVLALRQCRQLRGDLEEAGAVAADPQHRQIMQHIDCQQFDIAALAAGVHPFADVGVGVERELRYHVVVGDHQVAGADQEAGTDR